jgi:hypothetical protein
MLRFNKKTTPQVRPAADRTDDAGSGVGPGAIFGWLTGKARAYPRAALGAGAALLAAAALPFLSSRKTKAPTKVKSKAKTTKAGAAAPAARKVTAPATRSAARKPVDAAEARRPAAKKATARVVGKSAKPAETGALAAAGNGRGKVRTAAASSDKKQGRAAGTDGATRQPRRRAEDTGSAGAQMEALPTVESPGSEASPVVIAGADVPASTEQKRGRKPAGAASGTREARAAVVASKPAARGAAKPRKAKAADKAADRQAAASTPTIAPADTEVGAPPSPVDAEAR